MNIMKMVMAVVPKGQAEDVIHQLVANGHTATLVESRGGVLRQTSELLFIVVEKTALEGVLGIISGTCRSDVSVVEAEMEAGPPRPPVSRTPQIGGAVVFVWQLEDCRKY
jgi:uncharacterized protein YaaQ